MILLGNRLREVRKSKNLTIQQVADAIGVGRNTISRYENEKHYPKPKTWQKLADFFGVSVAYLQGLEEDYSQPTKKTRFTIVNFLNVCYLEKYDNWDGFNIFESFNVKNGMSRFAKLNDISFDSLDKSSLNIDFWEKNFSFVLNDKGVIETANRLNAKKVKLLDFIHVVSKCINNKNEELYNSDFSDHLTEKYNSKIYSSVMGLTSDLSFSSSLNDVNISFEKCLKGLKQIQKEINQDIKSGHFKQEMDYQSILDLQPITYTQQSNELYKKDKKYREFYNNSEYLVPVKIYEEYLKAKNKDIPELTKYIKDNPELNLKKE